MYTSAGHCFTACVKRAGQGEAVATWGFKVNFITINQGAAGTLHRRPGPHAQADEDDTVESNNLDHDDDLHKMD